MLYKRLHLAALLISVDAKAQVVPAVVPFLLEFQHLARVPPGQLKPQESQ